MFFYDVWWCHYLYFNPWLLWHLEIFFLFSCRSYSGWRRSQWIGSKKLFRMKDAGKFLHFQWNLNDFCNLSPSIGNLHNFVSFVTKNLLWILLIFITTEFAIPFSAEYALKGFRISWIQPQERILISKPMPLIFRFLWRPRVWVLPAEQKFHLNHHQRCQTHNPWEYFIICL